MTQPDPQPRDGVAWGEASTQAHPEYPEPEDPPDGWNNQHTDADEIRRAFSIAPFNADPEAWESVEYPYPNCIHHDKDGEPFGHVGGTNWLAVGEKGSGKSTLALHVALRLMEVNNEAVIWRGSTTRSEWLPFKHWTRLCLPANADVDPEWKPRDMTEQNAGESAALEDVVREVVYYDDPVDLNQQIQPGKFHVVYPDPSFTGCDRIMRESDYMAQPTEHVPAELADEDETATPVVHWWFAWAVAKIEDGPWDWTTLIFDEAADWAPQSAKADENQTYHKIEALRGVMADSRKYYFSLMFFAHHEANVHEKVRRTFQWRVDMPDGTANRNQDDHKAPVGFSKIPMYHDMLSKRDPGKMICWTETNFTLVEWPDIPVFAADENRWLKIALACGHAPARGGAATPTGEVADD